MSADANVTVSVIIPVYNGERFLDECIDSVLKSALKTIEIILIDDGSTDNSGKICDNYADKDGRIKVIHKKNCGVSAARNDGINICTGKYISFVDADDKAEPYIYRRAVFTAEQSGADVVIFDSRDFYADGKSRPDTLNCFASSTHVPKERITPQMLRQTAGGACRCLYKASLIKNNNIRFDTALKLSEDRVFNLYSIGQAESVYYLKEQLYNRRIHGKSAVHRYHNDYYKTVKSAYTATENALNSLWGEEYINEYKSQFISGAISAMCNCFYKTSNLKLSEKIHKIGEICDDDDLKNAVIKTGYGGIRGKWILKRRVCLLSALSILSNLKNGA